MKHKKQLNKLELIIILFVWSLLFLILFLLTTSFTNKNFLIISIISIFSLVYIVVIDFISEINI